MADAGALLEVEDIETCYGLRQVLFGLWLSVWSGQNPQGDATVRLTFAITIGARAPLA